MCVEEEIESIKRSACVASEISGFVPYFLVAKWSDILSFPTIGNSTASGYTKSEKRLMTVGSFIFNPGKTWNRIEAAELQKIDLETTAKGNSWESVMKVMIQNSMHTRGWSDAMKNERLVILAFESDKTNPVLLGTSQYFAKFGKDKAKVKFGGDFNAEKGIDIEIEFMPKMPAVYMGTVVEATLSSGTATDGGTQRISFAGLTAAVNNFLSVYDADGVLIYQETTQTATKTSPTFTAGTFSVSIQQAGKAAIFVQVTLA